MKEFHKVANIFPLLEGEKYEELKADIQENGLLEPIWLHSDGSIIDGRNRYRACLEVGVKPEYRIWDNRGSLLAFVISMNLHRRHFTSGQLAMLSLEIMPMLEEEAKERKITTLKQNFTDVATLPPRENLGKSRDLAGKIIGTSGRNIQDAKKIQKESPELAEQVKDGKLSILKAKKKLRKIELEKKRKKLADKADNIPASNRWHVETADLQTYQTDKQFDYIITDPPYLKEYLPLYSVLAERSKEWLTPDGLLIVMCGQSYLDDIYSRLSEHLYYYWTACYLTPGQPTPLRHRQVNTTWKPILIFSPSSNYKGKIFGDVYTSQKSDKDFHTWGQSVSGMLSMVEQICLPGQSIFDPFLGAGTTGIAALTHGCLFTGIDIEEENVKISKSRLGEICFD